MRNFRMGTSGGGVLTEAHPRLTRSHRKLAYIAATIIVAATPNNMPNQRMIALDCRSIQLITHSPAPITANNASSSARSTFRVIANHSLGNPAGPDDIPRGTSQLQGT